MLSRIVGSLEEALDQVVVAAAPGQDLPPLAESVKVVRDSKEGLGPLNGLFAGLTSLADAAEILFVTSCDVPFLKPAFIRRVVDLVGSHQIAIPRIGGIPQPLAAAYRVEGLTNRVAALLAAGRRAPRDLLLDADVRDITADELRDVDPQLESLFNVNTPDDYATALRMAARA